MFWIVIEQLKINQFYTTPSSIRALMIEGEEVVDKFALKSLRVIGSGSMLSKCANINNVVVTV